MTRLKKRTCGIAAKKRQPGEKSPLACPLSWEFKRRNRQHRLPAISITRAPWAMATTCIPITMHISPYPNEYGVPGAGLRQAPTRGRPPFGGANRKHHAQWLHKPANHDQDDHDHHTADDFALGLVLKIKQKSTKVCDISPSIVM